MKKVLAGSVVVLAVLSLGFLFIHCGGGDEGGCKSNADCAATEYCDLTVKVCKCAPVCTGKCGGDNGCGGTCPNNCPTGTTCNQTTYTCDGSCTPNCTGKCGGSDGCSGSCPNTCVAPNPYCQADNVTCGANCTAQCAGKCGGPDGCGGSCPNTCTGGQTCQAPSYTTCSGTCTPQTCAQLQKACGLWDDGCGTQLNCGNCVNPQVCNAVGQCVTPGTTEECPTGQACTDVTGTGFMACTEGGQIPANSQTGCSETVACEPNHSCLTADQTTVCTANCGTCPTSQTCEDLTNQGDLGCLADNHIPATNATGCDATPCTGNYNCWCLDTQDCTGTNAVCIENCTVDGPCQAGTTRCEGTVIMNCTAGAWVAGTDCNATGQTCFNGACASADLCPTGQSCDVLADEATGCLEGGEIPASNQTNCASTGCTGNFSCWCLDQACTGSTAVCIENCGTCPTGQDCTDVTGDGGHACTDGGAVPANAQTGCDSTGCTGNASCWCTDQACTGATAICLFNCSVPH